MGIASEKVMKSRQELVGQMISKMEEGQISMRNLWRNTSRPYNPESGFVYSGGNYLRLLMTANQHDYHDPRWMTYKQASKAGYHVKKGEKSTLLERWIVEKEVKEKDETGRIIKKTEKLDHPICNYFLVFNAEQLEGIEPLPEVQPMEHDQMLQTAENFMKSSECEIEEIMQNRSYYSPSTDKIVLPPRDVFADQEAFLSVVLHEMAHSTGHESRLNRPLMNLFGTKDYAREELNAEMASAFVQSDLGIHLDGQLLDDHAGYLQSWIQILKNDPNELFRAANQADKISKYLTKNYERILQEERTKSSIEENDSKKKDEIIPDSSEPQVTILWSESNHLQDGQILPLHEADALFERLDMEQKGKGYYNKTSFLLHYVFRGQADSYEGRQDFGDGDGSLIQHIQSYNEYYIHDKDWKSYVLSVKGKEVWEEDKSGREILLNEVIPYMKLHCNLAKLEHTAKEHLQSDEILTSEERTYYKALLSYVNDGRRMLNQGEYQLPEVPKLIQKKSDDILVHYYPINETDAKRANEANSFYDYQPGSATEEYRRYVKKQNWHMEEKPYASYQLSNNNANIRRLKQRIELLNCHRNTNYPGWKFYGGEVTANKEANRMQIFFDDKPDESIRTELKRNGFRWALKEKAWQRQLNQNAYYAADSISAIYPITGEKPTQLNKAKQDKQLNLDDAREEQDVQEDFNSEQERAFIFDEALEYGMTPKEFEQRIRGQPALKSQEHDIKQLMKDVTNMLAGDSRNDKKTKKRKKQRCR